MFKRIVNHAQNNENTRERNLMLAYMLATILSNKTESDSHGKV